MTSSHTNVRRASEGLMTGQATEAWRCPKTLEEDAQGCAEGGARPHVNDANSRGGVGIRGVASGKDRQL